MDDPKTISMIYLDKVKIKQCLKNQNQLALFFDVTRQSISQYYAGKRNFDIGMLIKVSKALELPIAEIGIKLCIEQARTEKVRNYWEKELENNNEFE